MTDQYLSKVSSLWKTKKIRNCHKFKKHGDITITSHVDFRIEFWTKTDTNGKTGEIWIRFVK